MNGRTTSWNDEGGRKDSTRFCRRAWNEILFCFFFFFLIRPDQRTLGHLRFAALLVESVNEISLKSAIHVPYARSVRKNRLFPSSSKITFHERLEKVRERGGGGEGERVSYRWLAKNAGKKLMKPRESSSSLFTFDRELG